MANYCCKCGYKVKNEWVYCPACGALLPVLEEQKSPTTENTAKKPEVKPITTFIKPVAKEPQIQQKNHPTIPRKVDRQVFEARLKEYRLLKAEEEHMSPSYIFENKAIDTLVEARNRILVKQDLYAIKYWAEIRINKYGNDIIDILNQLDQNYISSHLSE